MGLLHKKKEKKPLGKRLSRGFVILVIACLAFLWLAGCSYPGSEAYRQQSGDEEPAPGLVGLKRLHEREVFFLGRALVEFRQRHAEFAHEEADGLAWVVA